MTEKWLKRYYRTIPIYSDREAAIKYYCSSLIIAPLFSIPNIKDKGKDGKKAEINYLPGFYLHNVKFIKPVIYDWP